MYKRFNYHIHMKITHFFLTILAAIRVWPAWMIVNTCSEKGRFKQDFIRWCRWKQLGKTNFWSFAFLMALHPAFRSVVYYRTKNAKYLVRWLCSERDDIFIYCKDIGGGFCMQHGFATIVNAEKIGENFTVYQQVTIGYNKDSRPTIGDNVEVCCGAKVIGGIKIGDNVVVGANAFVNRDVPNDCIAVGVPAVYKKRNK